MGRVRKSCTSVCKELGNRRIFYYHLNCETYKLIKAKKYLKIGKIHQYQKMNGTTRKIQKKGQNFPKV